MRTARLILLIFLISFTLQKRRSKRTRRARKGGRRDREEYDSPHTEAELENLKKEVHRAETTEYPDEPEYLNEKTFFEQYARKKSDLPEVEVARKYFPTAEAVISRERYESLIMMFLDGTVHEEEIDEDIREEAKSQLKEHLDVYMKTVRKGQEEFTLRNYFEDTIQAKFHKWQEKTYPEVDPEIEGEDDL
jgi:tRNA(Ser,Leu) C12 N-acetylase TAN1